MKKILLVLGVLLMVTGCAKKSNVELVESINFVGANNANYRINLTPSADYENAVMIDNEGKKYHLIRAKSASGIRFVNKNAEIMFKSGEGIVNFGGNDIFLKYQK